jgi:tyrosyl-tRNA synthetase
MTIIEDLQARGLCADCTDLGALAGRLAGRPIVLYAGFDPSADSLHFGNLVPLLALRRFQLAGHHPIALAGGATGMIGDPSGRSDERSLLDPELVGHNIACQKVQLSRFLDFEVKSNPARLVNNADWTAGVTYLEFLRDIGKHFTVNNMVAKESVRARMEDREGGITYTEFSYMLLQAFDFYHLRKTRDCELQIGATDQWGNITAGADLIRRKLGVPAYGLVFPLLTKSDGTKYGKTASGAVWLDPKRTSPYRFYQFFMQAGDGEAPKLLKALTFVEPERIAELEQATKADPGARAAQRTLARELTELVHGKTACADAMRASEIMFGGGLEGISEPIFQDVIGEVPTSAFDRNRLAGAGAPLTDLLVSAGLCSSKGQARKDIEGGGIYLNNGRVSEATRTATSGDLLFGKYLLLRKGKRTYAVVNAV